MRGKNQKFYITTAIDYVNAKPHLGHAFEKIQADVLARYNRLLDRGVLFLTGTDENSLKNVRAAEKAELSVQDFVDKNAQIFYSLKDALNLSFDEFIRTTEQKHIKGAQKLWQACEKDIYQDEYRGLYCVGCESYYTEEELENGCCPEHKTKPELIKETNYFFKLSKYQKQIEEAIEKEKIKIFPEGRKNEILSFVKQGLKDICVSRSQERAQGWGVDVPGDKSQKIWCWFDALGNYITALDFGDDGENFEKYWQKGHILHCIGKGISRFHAIYWPGILLSAGLKLPDEIFVHGYITSSGQKMSKSLGNVIDPFELVKKYGIDPVRYFLLREISPTEDGDFTYEKFEERYNADLANGIGNLVARVLTLANKIFNLPIFNFQTNFNDSRIKTKTEETKKDCARFLEEFRFNEALGAIWEMISFCDKYINETKPWEGKEGFKEVISDLLLAIQSIDEMLKPFLPQTSERILSQLGTGKSEILFPRLSPTR